MNLGDKQLIVQRASVGAKNAAIPQDNSTSIGMPINIPGLQIPSGSQVAASTVLCLMNMVTEEDLVDDEEYEGDRNNVCLSTFITQ